MQRKRIKTSLPLVGLSVLLAFGYCGDGSEENAGNEANQTTPAVALTGTPAQNMITVMEMGVNALRNNSSNPGAAAAELNSLMASYDIADIRAQSRAARDAGQGATDAEKSRFQALLEEYKTLSTQVGAIDPAAFNAAHSEWSRLWSIN
ncbi:MAG: hypothetical protein H7A21_04770 [Spirochaetales bacterium]|nr:hypothetical protein [Leptospiraceae bacterium]MCP5480726.1 hypothetical protein [Spirochaetales bacterium]MCP5484078.1 hypothetical protein [Spirochaetales bacterium]